MTIARFHICCVGPDEEALHEAFRQCGAMVRAWLLDDGLAAVLVKVPRVQPRMKQK